ncbi:MAG: caspase family protein, partial [Bacteroidia bacterium]|nr:caspase family protein [Bacteroidia bacterium]
NEISLLNVFSGEKLLIEKQTTPSAIYTVAENKKFFAIKTTDTVINIFNAVSFKKLYSAGNKKLTHGLKSMCLHPVKDEITISNYSDDVIVVDLKKNLAVARMENILQWTSKPKYTADGKFLITTSSEGFVRFWETATYTNVLSNYSNPEDESYISFSENNFYVASSNIQKRIVYPLAYFVFGNNFFELSDLDVEYNHPDIIANVLGYESQDVMEAYKLLYTKRIKRLHRNINSAFNSKNRPVLRSVGNYPPVVDKSELELVLQFYDKTKKIKKLKVSINDVPVFGMEGYSLQLDSDGFNAYVYTIHLNSGTNKVSVRATNEDNIDSYPYTFTTYYQTDWEKNKPKLHIIGIGVSEFANSKYNLKYPAKDVRDFVKLFQNQKNQYSQIIVDTLINGQATLENILKLKEKIHNDHTNDSMGVNDKVILFAATHGVLDKNLDYYLATYDVNFETPSENGLLYSEIEKLLDNIAPRKKVVLIDACHSGEIDKDEVLVTKKDTVADQGAISFRAASSTSITSKEGALKNSLNLMKEMFIDLRKSSGATVISSAGGTEYAIEGEEWNNGVFTYSMINALRKHKADTDNDNKVYLSELQKYIEEEVPRITNGKQQPTSRSENIANDVLIWKNDFNE